MMPIRQLGIAVIGDKDLVNGLRLIGVSRYYMIEDSHNASEDVREALGELIGDPGIGVVIILEEYAKHVEDLIIQLRGGKRFVPVIVEVPPRGGTTYGDVGEYYKEFIKRFLGFEIEI